MAGTYSRNAKNQFAAQAAERVRRSEAVKKGWETRRARAQAKMLQNVQDAVQDALDQDRLAQAVETGMGRPIGYVGKGQISAPRRLSTPSLTVLVGQ